MKIKDSALKALIAEVEAEIGSLLKSEGEKLAKAADDLDQEAEEKPEESAPAAEMSAPSEDPSAEDSAEASAPMEDAPMGDAPEASADDAQAAPEGAEGGQMDTEALKAEYMKLPPEELEAHFMAAKAAMEALMGDADQGAEGLGAGAPAMKAEPAAKKAGLMEKSEKNIANDSRLQELEAQVEGLVKALDLALGQPMRKAVTSVAYVPRTEETKPSLSKGEVVEKLKEITKQPLKKSDRELINRYCLGEVEVDKIQHLLQGK